MGCKFLHRLFSYLLNLTATQRMNGLIRMMHAPDGNQHIEEITDTGMIDPFATHLDPDPSLD